MKKIFCLLLAMALPMTFVACGSDEEDDIVKVNVDEEKDDPKDPEKSDDSKDPEKSDDSKDPEDSDESKDPEDSDESKDPEGSDDPTKPDEPQDTRLGEWINVTNDIYTFSGTCITLNISNDGEMKMTTTKYKSAGKIDSSEEINYKFENLDSQMAITDEQGNSGSANIEVKDDAMKLTLTVNGKKKEYKFVRAKEPPYSLAPGNWTGHYYTDEMTEYYFYNDTCVESYSVFHKKPQGSTFLNQSYNNYSFKEDAEHLTIGNVVYDLKWVNHLIVHISYQGNSGAYFFNSNEN